MEIWRDIKEILQNNFITFVSAFLDSWLYFFLNYKSENAFVTNVGYYLKFYITNKTLNNGNQYNFKYHIEILLKWINLK